MCDIGKDRVAKVGERPELFFMKLKIVGKNLRYYSISVFSLLYFVERNIENN